MLTPHQTLTPSEVEALRLLSTITAAAEADLPAQRTVIDATMVLPSGLTPLAGDQGDEDPFTEPPTPEEAEEFEDDDDPDFDDDDVEDSFVLPTHLDNRISRP